MNALKVRKRIFAVFTAVLAVQLACTSYSFETSNEKPIGSTPPAATAAPATSERGTPAEAQALCAIL